ncbi:hypothetical protein XENORESO_016284 [Xenotaenia resolanae]|uniref:Uncharacterized protein n=1 Tax=Xenotaenia resolanae TaxID=208358 RepID=A0ABV0X9Q6_9TELE
MRPPSIKLSELMDKPISKRQQVGAKNLKFNLCLGLFCGFCAVFCYLMHRHENPVSSSDRAEAIGVHQFHGVLCLERSCHGLFFHWTSCCVNLPDLQRTAGFGQILQNNRLRCNYYF